MMNAVVTMNADAVSKHIFKVTMTTIAMAEHIGEVA